MVVGILVRCGIVAGAVYYTRQLGVWGNPEKTEELYNQAVTAVRPHVQKVQKQLPFEVPALPAKGEVRYLTKHYYNRGVKGTFHFIEMLPCYTGQGIQQLKLWWTDFSHPPTALEQPAPKSKK